MKDATPDTCLDGTIGNKCLSWILEVESPCDCIPMPEGGYYFWDDVNGKVLDWDGVRRARKDEI